MLKVGVIGLGQWGLVHLETLMASSQYDVVGVFDTDPIKMNHAVKQFQVNSFDSLDDLIAACDVLNIVTPTENHFDIASKAIREQKHVFIEKPVTTSLEEAKRLINLSHEAKVKVQVGHNERFNPAYAQMKGLIENPLFIESHRLNEFTPDCMKISVIHDLMIHDIDIILNIVNSTVKKVSATGVAVVNGTPDIANARIEFDNGAVASLTASRIATKNMRKTRIFQRNAYLTVDFLEQQAEHLKVDDEHGYQPFTMTLDLKNNVKKQLSFQRMDVKPSNAIQDELESFADAINNNTSPVVSLNDGHDAMLIANEILNKLKLTNTLVE